MTKPSKLKFERFAGPFVNGISIALYSSAYDSDYRAVVQTGTLKKISRYFRVPREEYEDLYGPISILEKVNGMLAVGGFDR